MDERNYYPDTARREKIHQENLMKEKLRFSSKVSARSGSIKDNYNIGYTGTYRLE